MVIFSNEYVVNVNKNNSDKLEDVKKILNISNILTY